MKRIRVLLCACMLCLLACVKTPEDVAIVNKGVDYLELAQTVSEHPFLAPSKVVNSSEPDEKISVRFEADVNCPEGSYPILQVSRRCFDENTLYDLAYFLAEGGTALYEPWAACTRELREEFVSLQEYDGSLPDFIDEGILEERKSELLKLIEDSDPTIYGTQYTFRDTDEEILYPAYGYGSVDDELDRFIMVARFDMNLGYNAFCFLRDRDASVYSTAGLPKTLQVDAPLIGEKEALAAANEFLEQFTDGTYVLSDAKEALVLHYVTRMESAWLLTFTRQIKGIPSICPTDFAALNPDMLPSVGAPWAPEVLTIGVDQHGIMYLDWMGISSAGETLVEDCRFEPFETVIKRFTNQITYDFAGQQTSSKDKYAIRVKEISLRYGLLSEKDKPNLGRYVPLWEFVYDIGYENEEAVSEERMYLNAIDGSYVEPRVTNTYLMGLS